MGRAEKDRAVSSVQPGRQKFKPSEAPAAVQVPALAQSPERRGRAVDPEQDTQFHKTRVNGSTCHRSLTRLQQDSQ